LRTPIALFVYSRLDHTRRTIEALLKNPEAINHDLIIYSDAPRSIEDEKQVETVRTYLKTISGFRSVLIRERAYNFGLAKSIIEGVTEVLSQHERIIVLEDDMVSSPYFLAYMNQGLECYANNQQVISIHGYVYPVQSQLPDAFFLRGADCWGWATWRRAWALFNSDGQYLLDELKRRNLLMEFDFNGSFGFSAMLKSQIAGDIDSWAIRWHASAFLADMITLYPGRSLIQNIGNDNTGTNCGDTSAFEVILSDRPINIEGLIVEESKQAAKIFEEYFYNKTSRIKRVVLFFIPLKTLMVFSEFSRNWIPKIIDRQIRKLIHGGKDKF
jgi:hypothetical protein